MPVEGLGCAFLYPCSCEAMAERRLASRASRCRSLNSVALGCATDVMACISACMLPRL